MNDQTEMCSDHSGHIEEISSQDELLCKLAHCLKNAREAQKLTVEEIALSLKLRTIYLKSLESGDWSDMPGEVYAVAFLKQYASFLDLDISESLEKLKTGQYKLTKPLTFPDPPIAPNKTWGIVAVLVFVVLFILFNLYDNGADHVSDEQQNVSSSTLIEDTLLPSPVTITQDETVKDSDLPTMTESTELELEIEKELPDATIEHTYQLTAVGDDVWLQLSLEATSGETPVLLREVLLRDGQSTTLHHISPSLLLTCGNAIALQVHIDQKLIIAAGSLGEGKKVLRNFKLAVQ